MINSIIRVYYDNMAHCDLEKTIKGITANRWFPPVKKKLRYYLDKLRYQYYQVSIKRLAILDKLRYLYTSFKYFRSPKILYYMWTFVFCFLALYCMRTLLIYFLIIRGK